MELMSKFLVIGSPTSPTFQPLPDNARPLDPWNTQ